MQTIDQAAHRIEDATAPLDDGTGARLYGSESAHGSQTELTHPARDRGSEGLGFQAHQERREEAPGNLPRRKVPRRCGPDDRVTARPED